MNALRYRSQVLVIGSGLAGCAAALTLADRGFEVHLLMPTEGLDGGNSAMAQGGIVFSTDPEDQKSLEHDMFVAGHDYNYAEAVHFLAGHGGEAVQKMLIDKLHVPFDRNEQGSWDMTLEGGHAVPRIAHCADYTGRTIIEYMHAAVAAHENITVLAGRSAVDLVTTEHHARCRSCHYQLTNQCVGAYAFNDATGEVELHLAEMTVLATGGVGQVYLYSTNNPWATGSGISMAHRAGVRLANMEFMQFHPTGLYNHAQQIPLLTEALRGEGAHVVNGKGERFVSRYDSRGDLAPRDIVSQAIVSEMLATGENHMLLDCTTLDCDVTRRFPTVFESCRKIGIDMRVQPLPIVPVAHYFCGGILVDLHGRTTLDRLYAVGECSCTGIHGANRLASTSLLEALLWGISAGVDIASRMAAEPLDTRVFAEIEDWKHTGNEHNDDPALIAQDWATIRHTMWNYVGIIRTESRLRRAFADLRDLSSHLHDFYRHTPLTQSLVHLFHGCQTAYLITQAAMRNKQSLGCHYRKD
ncbi:L-aspartate oxidase [Mailhella massiliensis]|uniref:L-aspartate oxidase n=1 Tax=Mailhella massiliensis TaxID=1903261 RepID=A0A921AWF8_9BACT|nr:L-aspartate oxidase [Mailhella massiliensis]HJD97135.1 L-aspartate oxidase [Mailhella massiliensis]